MKIILSRKGFDSGAGGTASPVFEDGACVSLPIPEPKPNATPHEALVRYTDLQRGGASLGPVVEGLTGGGLGRHTRASRSGLARRRSPRAAGWRAAFGQVGAAQAHLANQGVGPGDLFLFFGWFRAAENARGQYRFRPGATDVHALFGWLQVDAVLPAGPDVALPPWVAGHPHATTQRGAPNVLYVARDVLTIDGAPTGLPGAGVFGRLHDHLIDRHGPRRPSRLRSRWRLPLWFRPEGQPRMTYHTDSARWTDDPASADHVLLRTAGKGQEFVADASPCPGVLAWAADLIVVMARRRRRPMAAASC